MIKFLIHFTIFSLIFLSNLFSQNKITWFPNELNIQPFTANVIEPKTGFEFLLGRSEIRLNAGTSRDLYKTSDEKMSLSFGADFFTYSLLRSERDFHFPVDAIDYLFGLNSGYKLIIDSNEIGFRCRLSHISAHFVDGHFDYRTNSWRDGKRPQVYSREFIELFPFIRISNLRMYAGFTYLFNVTPASLGKDIYQLGFDFYQPNMLFNRITPFAAYDFKLSKINVRQGSNSIVLGLKFGTFDSKGFSIRFSYLSGMSIHGEYFDVFESYSTVGFNLEL